MNQEIAHKRQITVFEDLRDLLQASPILLQRWIKNPSIEKTLLCIITIIIGCGLYGFSIGAWRSPLMGVYVGIKLPLLIFLTLLCNGFLNGILGLVLKSELGFQQSTLCLLMSFTIFSLINLGLSPATLFFALNLPNVHAEGATSNHASYLLAHTLIIAFSGTISNLHLYRLLKKHTKNSTIAYQTLAAWLLGNAFVGAQFSWILRPFFGSPRVDVQFLREDMMEGTFYEAVFRSLHTLLEEAPNTFVFLTAIFGLLALISTLLYKTQQIIQLSKTHERRQY